MHFTVNPERASQPTRKIFYSFFLLFLLLVWSASALAETHSLYLPLLAKPYQLQNGDFEKGRDGSWKESSLVGYPIILTGGDLQGLSPQGGVWAAWMGGDNNEQALLSQVISIPANAAFLKFYYWIESYELAENCGYDFAYVRFGNNPPTRTYDLCLPRNSSQWVLEQIDLTAYRGQTVELVFELKNDDTDHSNFFLDTISVTTTLP